MDTIRYRLRMLEDNQRSIAQSLQALVRLEQHHADTRSGLERAWKAIETDRARMQAIDDQIPEKLGERLDAIEDAMPTLKLTSRWVVMFTLGGFALAAALVWSAATEQRRLDYLPSDRRPHPTEPADSRPR
jgi:hypothetical protein